MADYKDRLIRGQPARRTINLFATIENQGKIMTAGRG